MEKSEHKSSELKTVSEDKPSKTPMWQSPMKKLNFISMKKSHNLSKLNLIHLGSFRI